MPVQLGGRVDPELGDVMDAYLCGAALAIVLGTGIVVVTGAAIGAGNNDVSQKGRTFQPAALTIKRGEAVQIVNDDADLLHHAYVDTPEFSFDSGDQAPGEKARIVFPVAGTFAVLCGIHPKMKLTVRVEAP
jgi:plastocyanin